VVSLVGFFWSVLAIGGLTIEIQEESLALLALPPLCACANV